MTKIAVVGIYQTQFGELWDKSLEDLMSEAAFGCLKDGGVEARDIQAAFVGNMLAGLGQSQQHLSSLVNQILGVSIPVTRVEAACASGGMAIRTAIQAISAGEIETAMVLGAEKMTDLDHETVSQALMTAASESEVHAGLSFPGLYGLLANQYLQSFEANPAYLAQVSVKNHHHGSLNPKAHFRHPITVEHVLQSPVVADPLHMLDCSPISDGAAAVFLATPQWVAKRRSRNGVYITGSAHWNDVINLADRDSLTELAATRLAGAHAFERAGIETKDIDCVEVHDCFTIAEILAVEDLGLYPKGEGYTAIQHSKLGGKLPVNTSGGLKACGHPVGATGVKQIVELTQQLRAEAGARQVAEAKVGVAQNVGGTGGTAVVTVLQR